MGLNFLHGEGSSGLDILRLQSSISKLSRDSHGVAAYDNVSGGHWGGKRVEIFNYLKLEENILA